jgi:hypothetical protein
MLNRAAGDKCYRRPKLPARNGGAPTFTEFLLRKPSLDCAAARSSREPDDHQADPDYLFLSENKKKALLSSPRRRWRDHDNPEIE